MRVLSFLFYVMSILFIATIFILFMLNWVPFETTVSWLKTLYFNPELHISLGIASAVFVLIIYACARGMSASQQRGRTIAFDNPAGRVSVSLTALEDLVKRVILRVPEVREVRSFVAAGKKGLEIDSRLILSAEVNIPEMTSKLQTLVTRKIQDTIGIEEAVMVRVHVTKIIPVESKARKAKDKEPSAQEESPAAVPFQGYRP